MNKTVCLYVPLRTVATYSIKYRDHSAESDWQEHTMVNDVGFAICC
jgi:hypothetical protein